MNLDRLLAAPFLRLFEWLLLGIAEIENLLWWSSSLGATERRRAMAGILQQAPP